MVLGVVLNFWNPNSTGLFMGSEPPGPDVWTYRLLTNSEMAWENSLHKIASSSSVVLCEIAAAFHWTGIGGEPIDPLKKTQRAALSAKQSHGEYYTVLGCPTKVGS
jgi:hypothetical protein